VSDSVFIRARARVGLHLGPAPARGDLTKAERAEQVALWIQLTEEKQEAERAKAEAEEQELTDNLSGKSRGRPEGGVAAAAREINVPGKTPEAKRKNAARAVKIASITPEAKKAAKDLPPDHPVVILRG